MISARERTTIRISAQSVEAFLPLLFFLLNLYRMLGHSAVPYLGILALTGGVGLLELFLQRKQSLGEAILLFFLYLLTLIANWLWIKNVTTNDLAVSTLMFGIGIVMIVHPWSYCQGAVCFYITAGVFLFRWLRGANTHTMLVSSGNYISVLLVLANAFYYVGLDREDRRIRLIDLVPAAGSFMLAIWAKGRGGILSCGVLLALVLILYTRGLTGRNAKRLVFLFLFLLTALVVMIMAGFNPLERFFSLGKFASRGTTSGDRMVIWGAYLSKATESLPNFLFGGPLSEIPVIMRFEGNCHNSFLQLHAFNGIFMLLAFMALLVKSGFYYLRNGKLLTLSMFFVLCLRGFTDKFIFGQYGMPLILFFILYPFVDRQLQAAKTEMKGAAPVRTRGGRT